MTVDDMPAAGGEDRPLPSGDGSEVQRVRWERGRYGSLYGYVGSLQASVFTISRSTSRNDPAPSVLRSDLPGFMHERKDSTEEDSIRRAEAVLVAFVSKIGASL